MSGRRVPQHGILVLLVTFCVALALVAPSSVRAATATVAVAANFTEPARELARLFEQRTDHTVEFSFGSTGTLYAQITQGAPLDAFLAADQAHPQRAVDGGFAAADSLFTYAIGELVLYSADPTLVEGPETLRRGAFEHITIANPVTAPYGAAAIEAMTALGVYDALKSKLVQGNSIAQAFQFVATGNAELGFVALSQVIDDHNGSQWLVPEELHDPIRQDAVLLREGEDNEAALAFMAFLRHPEARDLIERFGYSTVD